MGRIPPVGLGGSYKNQIKAKSCILFIMARLLLVGLSELNIEIPEITPLG